MGLGVLESEAAGMAESEELGTQKTEAGDSGFLGTKTRMAETEIGDPGDSWWFRDAGDRG